MTTTRIRTVIVTTILTQLTIGAGFVNAQTTFTVTHTGDRGPGSLRQAIFDANSNSGPDVIAFAIPGSGPHTITPTSSLPTITDSVVIDGYTQPGSSPNTKGPGLGSNAALMIELNGGNVSSHGIRIIAGNSTVRGLVVNRFGAGGSPFFDGIQLTGNGGNVIEGNFLGTDVTGTLDLGNARHGVGIGCRDNRVGGQSCASRNVISGNGGAGVSIFWSGTTGNVVEGNFVGTDISGTRRLGNERAGVLISAGAAANLVGGTTEEARNVIGDNYIGVTVSGAGTSWNAIEGNYIGTDVTGRSPLGNEVIGVVFNLGASNNRIGGVDAGAGNVISGNRGNGVQMDRGVEENLVQGNYIGVDATGASALSNAQTGVAVLQPCPNNTIGGTSTGARNVISGNQRGVVIFGSGSSSNAIVGNLIGTDVTGTMAIGNEQVGISINTGPTNTTVGGATIGARNVISANGVGVQIRDASSNLISGNFVGTDVTGAADLGNQQSGIACRNASDNTIGGTTPGAGNKVAYNATGVAIVGGVGNAIQGNSIANNDGLGIDLDLNGVTTNDPYDADAGANDRQNFPVITDAGTGGGFVVAIGTLHSLPATTFRLEFFANEESEPSGHGEGQTFVGYEMVTTDIHGNASFAVSFPSALPSGQLVSATATDPNHNTSEFSKHPTIAIGGCDSGVVDRVVPGLGRTISSLIDDCAASARNHGQFVGCVAQLTRDLNNLGVLTGLEKGAINKCAARSNVGGA